ncbi:hypothetical protein PHK61_19840 [Actinomycetospora lutea]|uniref:hypothetical protein n=1 Tax=Actinomycetospora lutea TaxID=663604 RepID=UPI0023657410|nr:hypothetical protein [Actinomycetospora lutea]MDD7940681.1 hypothetical protein [Actinomycetospora lutea]
MADLDLHVRALEEARTAVAGESARMPGLADRLAATPTPDFGALAASAALADAVVALHKALVGDLESAGARLGEADRALDATMRVMQETDRFAARSLTAGGT